MRHLLTHKFTKVTTLCVARLHQPYFYFAFFPHSCMPLQLFFLLQTHFFLCTELNDTKTKTFLNKRNLSSDFASDIQFNIVNMTTFYVEYGKKSLLLITMPTALRKKSFLNLSVPSFCTNILIFCLTSNLDDPSEERDCHETLQY